MVFQDRLALRALNGIGGLLRTVGWRGPTFDPDRLERSAQREGEFAGFGSPRYRVPLERLCQSYASDPDLTPFGRIFVRRFLIRLLENRASIARTLRDDPGIRQETIRRPLFVLGLPRTGTTLLYNMLSQDPNCRPLMVWESMQPAPPPLAETYESDPRIAVARKRMQQLNRALPELAHIHEFRQEGPEECLGLLMNTFTTPFLRGRIPEYRDWLDAISDAEVDSAYQEYQDQLQILQRHVKGQHWVLKCPSHLYGLGSLLRTFPDAAVVFTHRDLAESTPSLFSLTSTIEQFCYRSVEPSVVAATILRTIGQLLDRGLRGRDAADPEGRRVLDIHFRETTGDPLGTIERIYDHFGYPFSTEFRRRAEQFLAADAGHRSGVRHRYTLEQYGVTPEQLDERFRSYNERFNMSRQG